MVDARIPFTVPPVAVIFLVGTNDLSRSSHGRKVRTDLSALINSAAIKFPVSKVMFFISCVKCTIAKDETCKW